MQSNTPNNTNGEAAAATTTAPATATATTTTGIGGGTVKKLLFPSFTNAGANETFTPPSPSNHHHNTSTPLPQQSSSPITTNNTTTALLPLPPPPPTTTPKTHTVEYDGSQVGGYAPSDLFSDDVGSGVGCGSPLLPLKLHHPDESLSSTTTTTNDASTTGNNSMELSMIVNTGASAVKQMMEEDRIEVNDSYHIIAEQSIREEDDFGLLLMEEDDDDDEGGGGGAENEFRKSNPSLTSPIAGGLAAHRDADATGGGDTTTPVGSSIASPPPMTRRSQLMDNNTLRIPPSNDGNFKSNTTIDGGSQLLMTKPTANLFRSQSYGDHSEAPSSLLGCDFLGGGGGGGSEQQMSLLEGVAKRSVMLLDTVVLDDGNSNDNDNDTGKEEEERRGRIKSDTTTCTTKSILPNNNNDTDKNGRPNSDPMELDTTEMISPKFAPPTQYSMPTRGDDDDADGGDDSSSCDANSLVSEYGDDIGDLKIRLDDVYAMAAVNEEEEEEEEEEEASFVNKNSDDILRHRSNSKTASYDGVGVGDDNDEGDKENRVNRNPSHTTASNLLWKTTRMDNETTTQPTNTTTDSTTSTINNPYESVPPPKKDTTSPASPVRRKDNHHSSATMRPATPTTPIATVSAALRRFGEGMSQITRGNKSPSVTTDAIMTGGDGGGDSEFDLTNHTSRGSKSTSERLPQLSSPARLGSFPFRTTKSTEDSSENILYSPGGGSVRTKMSSPLHHVRSGCLSFVPESGVPPYANMLRINDSPPSSPMLIPKPCQFISHSTGHSARRLRFKSQSWDNTVMGRKKVLLQQQEPPGSTTTTATTTALFSSGLSAASTGVAFRNNGGSILVRDGQQPFQAAISPGRRNQFMNTLGRHPADDTNERVESVPTRKNSYPPVLLRSPQRVGDIEKEDALDILALLVERSVAFHEKTDQSVGIADGAKCVNDEDDCVAPSDNSQLPSQCQEDVPPSTTTATSSETNSDEQLVNPVQTTQQPCHSSSSVLDIQDSIEELRVLSKNHSDHETRMGALDELERSYTYALEMKRAALSASTWLHAIGRVNKNDEQHNNFTTANVCIDELVSIDSSNNGVATTEQLSKHHPHSAALSISDSVIDERMRMTSESLKLAMQNDQLQFSAKDQLNKRLDRELSVCRAEIGRLKSVTRSEGVFISPNKSILDDEGDDDSSASSNEDALFLENELSSFLEFNDDKDIDVSRDLSASQALSSTVNNTRELLLLKAQLSQANKKIKSMENDREQLQQSPTSGEDASSILSVEALTDSETKEVDSRDKRMENDSLPTEDDATKIVQDDQHDLPSQLHVSAIPFTDDLLKKDLDNYIEVIRKADKAEIEFLKGRLDEADQSNKNIGKLDEKMINVRMLDGENFVTEWNKLGPLPPPPDHDLDSPIVTALLSQWTDDCSTRDALISWMEKLIGGVDPISVPPLKLSSLDHQVRDGFTMHVLPLLLRRSDLHLEVTSRAQRRTSYDIIATVKSPQSAHCGSTPLKCQYGTSNLTQPSVHNHVTGSHMMAFKASGGINSFNDSPGECRPMHDTFKFFPQGIGQSHGTESGSVTHSSITENISNQIVKPSHLERRARTENVQPSKIFADSNLVGDDSTVGSSRPDSLPQKISQQPSIMAGAINAVGGLLSRRKLHQSPRKGTMEENKQHESPNQSHPPGSVLLPTLGKSPRNKFKNPFPNLSSITSAKGRADLPKSSTLVENEEEDQPYHRVVSAPPGRIGMTFVQYRGHAIISDVYQNSPLQGWVFPSDILIAIDEVPVSGKRVPEIVRILNARKERQRALRVISSHAMTDLMITQNAAAVTNG